jgi:hypothetical protein
MENEMKFRVGQRAWSSRHGWGTIDGFDAASQYPIIFKPDNFTRHWNYTRDGRDYQVDMHPTLFHKEQVFDFSEPNFPKGTLGYFWDDSMKDRVLFGFYSHKSDHGHHYSANGPEYINFCAYPELPPQFKDKSKS